MLVLELGLELADAVLVPLYQILSFVITVSNILFLHPKLLLPLLQNLLQLLIVLLQLPKVYQVLTTFLFEFL